MLVRRRVHITGNEDRDDEAIDGDNTRHDDGNQGLHQSVKYITAINATECRDRHHHTFMIRSGLKVPTPAIPIPDFAVPYAAPIARYEVS